MGPAIAKRGKLFVKEARKALKFYGFLILYKEE